MVVGTYNRTSSDYETPRFKLEVGVARATKNKSEISGDSSIQTKLNDGKHMLAISDGMGSRTECKKK